MTPRLIGVAGPSCAGKTELAGRLARVLRAPVIQLDCYYRDLAHLPLEERAKTNFDLPAAIEHELLAEHLAELAAGRGCTIPVYDFTRHVRSQETARVEPAEFIVVEGLFALYWENVRRLLNVKVFVDAPDEVCLDRRIDRDVRERGRTEESVRWQFATTVRPMAETCVRPTRLFADVVVSGLEPVEASVAAVLRLLAAGFAESIRL